jgi:hypothetical protein
MFWTIVGALAFFFIVLPLIFQVLMQKWFWYLIGWLVLALFAFVIIPECSKDSQRRSYQSEQVAAQAKAEALAQQKKAEQIKAIDDRRRNMLIEQAQEARHQNDLRVKAGQRQKEAEAKLLQQQRINNELLISENINTLVKAVESYESGMNDTEGARALKNYLRTLNTTDLMELQKAAYFIEQNKLNQEEAAREQMARIRRAIDIVSSTR